MQRHCETCGAYLVNNDCHCQLKAQLAAAQQQLAELQRERDGLREALGHMAWCSSCAQGSWEDCDEGRAAFELLNPGHPANPEAPNEQP